MELIEEMVCRSYLKREWGYFTAWLDGKDGELELIEDFRPLFELACCLFYKRGNGGAEAYYLADMLGDMLKRVLLMEPLTPIENEDEFLFTETPSGWLVSQRCKDVFKVHDKVCYIRAILWRDPKGRVFGGEVDGIKNAQVVKYPFRAKSIVIDVDDEGHLINPRQLEEVLEYYEPLDDDQKRRFEELLGRKL